MTWIDRWGDRDGDGFQEYKTRSTHGYYNQGWKDAGDADPARRRHDRAAPDRAVRAPGLRLRRQGAHGRHVRAAGPRAKRPSGCAARRGACSSSSTTASGGRPRGPTTWASTATSSRSGPWPRTPAICCGRASCRRARRARRGAPAGAGHVVGLGHPDPVVRASGLQPVQLPHRHRLAARQRHHRRRLPALRLRSRGGQDREGHVRCRGALPGQPAPGALRRPPARAGQLPGAVPRRERAAGLGGRSRHPAGGHPGRDRGAFRTRRIPDPRQSRASRLASQAASLEPASRPRRAHHRARGWPRRRHLEHDWGGTRRAARSSAAASSPMSTRRAKATSPSTTRRTSATPWRASTRPTSRAPRKEDARRKIVAAAKKHGIEVDTDDNVANPARKS